MHIYKDSNSEVTFRHPHPGPLEAKIFRGTTQVGSRTLPPEIPPNFNNKVADAFVITIDYVESQYAGQLRINWFDKYGFSRDQYVDVVTPIAPLYDLESVIRENGGGLVEVNTFRQEIAEMENTIRLIIEAYTGRTFTSEAGIRYARGVNSLTKLLDNAVSIDAIEPPLTADLRGAYTYLNIKQAPPEEYASPGFDGVIRVPKDYYNNVQYTVTGVWGTQDVPAPVQEAALILAKEFSCNEKLYRDRYLQIVSYADSRFQFNSQAFAGTGNVLADQLLDPFKRGGMIFV